MGDEKPLKPAELRKAFGETLERLAKLEERVQDQEAEAKARNLEAEARTEYIRSVQAKIDRYSREMADALPRLVAAEAQLGRANAAHDKLWGLLGQTAHGISDLRDLVNEALARKKDDAGT